MSEILLIPGYSGSGPEHWQTLWERRLPNARRVRQRDWNRPDRREWTTTVDREVRRCAAPPVLVAHSLGCLTVVCWAAEHEVAVKGALLVAPPDVEAPDALEEIRSFAPVPMEPLSFPVITVMSEDDPHATSARSRAFAAAWQSRLVSVGAAGHLNSASGLGSWPAGLELLDQLLA
jgi:uncharacterized protein